MTQYTDVQQSDLYQVNLGSNFQSVSTSPVQVSFNSTSPQPEEGSFVRKHGSYYYFFFSSGTSSLHAITSRCLDHTPSIRPVLRLQCLRSPSSRE